MVRRAPISNERVCDVDARALENACVPIRYWEASVKLFLEHQPSQGTRVGTIFERLTGAINDGKGIRIQGVSDSGKTFLAVALAKEVIRRGGVVTFLSSSDVISAISGKMRTQSDEDVFVRLKRSHLVVLDALGVESYRNSENGKSTLQSLLSKLYDGSTSLFITTTLSDTALEMSYGPGIFGSVKKATKPLILS